MRRFSPRARKIALIAHVIAGVGWLGVEAVLLALGLTGFGANARELIQASYIGIGLIAERVLIPGAFATLATGVVLSLTTSWGFVRFYWVTVKLIMNIALVAGTMAIVNRRMQQAAAAALAWPAGAPIDTLGPLRFQIVGAVVAALVLLLTATVLSVFKPWGMTPYGRRKAAAGGV
jgi:hypothetical protein